MHCTFDSMRFPPARASVAVVLALVVSFAVCPDVHAGRSLAQDGDPEWRNIRLKQIADDKREDGRAAKAFCNSPGFKKLGCGLATREEEEATIKKQCPGCGTLYFDMPEKLPEEVGGVDRYNTWGIRLISLACNGSVAVRSVFKVLRQPEIKKPPELDGINCTHTFLVRIENIDELTTKGGKASPVVRCELQLPSTGGSEQERVLKAKEGRCWVCGACSQGAGCPSRLGTWYSDTYTTVARGCDIDPQVGYTYHRVGFNFNPYTLVMLAKFEVCNSPGCFDAAAEQAKQKAAAVCVKGKCV